MDERSEKTSIPKWRTIEKQIGVYSANRRIGEIQVGLLMIDVICLGTYIIRQSNFEHRRLFLIGI